MSKCTFARLPLIVLLALVACAPNVTPPVTQIAPTPEPTLPPPTLAPTAASKTPAAVDVTYLANAGFLIRTQAKTILVDALFSEGLGEYLTPLPELLKSMTTGQPPFDHVDLVLATHAHDDHVDSSTVAAHLAHNPEGILVGPESVIAPLASNASLQRQLRQVMPAASERITLTIHGVEITALKIQHDNRPAVQHVGFIVTVDNVKLLFLGDSVGWTLSELESYHLDQDKIDLAFLNFYGFWQSSSQRELVKEFIRPQRIVLTHIPPAHFESVAEQVKLIDDPGYPPISLLQNSLGTIQFVKKDGKLTTSVSPTQVGTKVEAVSLTTEDNVTLSATLFGQGQLAVILAHQGTEGTDQKSWQPFAEVLAEKGYAALTLDFRGRGQSQGYLQASQLIKDVNAAIQFLRGRGYQRIVCMGASMGGTACLRAALDNDLAGLVVIASPMSLGAPTAVEPDEFSRLKLPKLYVCAENDRYSPVIPQMKQMFELSPKPKQLRFFPGTVHGTELFDTEYGDEFRNLLLGFMERLR